MASDPEQVKQLQCDRMEDLLDLIEKNKDCDNIFLYFCGAIDETGESWCPDCRSAEKIVENGLAKAKEGSVFILCVVGDKPKWKDPNNEFRLHEKFKLTCIPTLMKYNTPPDGRLGDADCQNQDLVNNFFEDKKLA